MKLTFIHTVLLLCFYLSFIKCDHDVYMEFIKEHNKAINISQYDEKLLIKII